MRALWQVLMCNRGENEEGKGNAGEGGEGKGNAGEAKFTQADMDRVVQDRLGRDRAKYADYEDLAKFKKEHEATESEAAQKSLEERKEYDKVKDQWGRDKEELQSQLADSKLQIQAGKIGSTLTTEISKQNAYSDAVELLRPLVKYGEDGSITIRGKDANGMDADLTVAQGVEQFLKDKPYLVKGSGGGGGDTAGGGAGAGGGGEKRNLSQELQNAMAVGDRKKINELKLEIKASHATRGMQQIL